MKTIITYIIFLVCSLGYAQDWQAVNITTTEDLNDIFFISESEGYIVSQIGSIFKSTDGGENWQSIYNNPTIKFNYICAISVSNGVTKLLAYGVQNGQSTLVSTFPNEEFFNWDVQGIDYFPRASIDGYIGTINGLMCEDNLIYFLENDTNDLKKIENNAIVTISDNVEIFGVIDNRIFYVNPTFDSLFYSSNGGNNFMQLSNYPSEYLNQNRSLYAKLYPYEDMLIIYCTYPGQLIRSSDLGDSWEGFDSGHSYGISINQNIFFNTFHYILYVQQNFGANEQNFEMSEKIRKIYFYNDNLGFVLGENGMIYKTTNMGGLLSTTEVEEEKKTINIHPNPAIDKLLIESPEPLVAYTIYDASGKLIQHSQTTTNTIEVVSLPKGFYVLKIRTDKNVYSKSFLKK